MSSITFFICCYDVSWCCILINKTLRGTRFLSITKYNKNKNDCPLIVNKKIIVSSAINLFNKDYQPAFGFVSSGITIYAGFNYKI